MDNPQRYIAELRDPRVERNRLMMWNCTVSHSVPALLAFSAFRPVRLQAYRRSSFLECKPLR